MSMYLRLLSLARWSCSADTAVSPFLNTGSNVFVHSGATDLAWQHSVRLLEFGL